MEAREERSKEARAKLAKAGQEHLFGFYDELSEAEQDALLAQILAADFSVLSQDALATKAGGRGRITPLRALTLPEIGAKRGAFAEKGLTALREGKCAAVLLAGGMGTRLGFDGPKGAFDIGLTKPVYIFQRLLENLQRTVQMVGQPLHLFVMTSEKNDFETRSFFSEHAFFGYPQEFVHFFVQDMAPCTDFAGRVLLEAKGRLATSPNGNGGWFTSLLRSDAGVVLRDAGIAYLNVFAVDNVLQNILDPVFVGAVLTGGYACGSKVVRKASPDEKVGVMCLEDGRPSVIEYTEMTPELLSETDENGEPAYNFGVILNYLFSVEELERVANERMLLHLARKKIPCIDAAGNAVSPDAPNGLKYELFILDQIHELPSCLPFEVEREREFAPVKNKEGVDSVESARELCRKNGILL